MSRIVRRGLVLAAIVTIVTTFGVGSAVAQTSQRPLQDWLSAQPGPGYFWYEPATGNTVLIDYFGTYNAAYNLNLGTVIDGVVTERALRGGRAEVTVILHSENVLVYGWQPVNGLVFGHTIPQVQGGADAALGSVLFTLTFQNTAVGAPLPGLGQLFGSPLPGQIAKSISVVMTAEGTLRASFGVPDGTPGMAHTTQRGLYVAPGFLHNGNGQDNEFPAEKVSFWAVGN